MAGKFVLKSTGNGKFMFNLKAGNGQTILTSEAYASRAAAVNGIESVRKNAGKDGNFERLKAKDGRPYFVLKAANLEPIGRSEMYASARGVENGIASVRVNARSARIEDLIE